MKGDVWCKGEAAQLRTGTRWRNYTVKEVDLNGTLTLEDAKGHQVILDGQRDDVRKWREGELSSD